MNSSIESPAARNAARRSIYHEADVVVVGAGVFGCAAAHALASQGRSVLLLERWMHEPDRIVGELLQPGGVAALRRLGLERCLEGIDAIPCYGYHVLYHDDDVVIPYPATDAVTGRVRAVVQKPSGAKGYHAASGQVNGSGALNGSAKATLKSEGRSFHHGRFVMRLREACMAHPNITVVETDVQKTISGEHSPQVLGVQTLTTDRTTGCKSPDYFFGQLTIIADGYASRFREQLVGKKPIVRSKFYALELIDCPLPPSNFGHVVIGNASPILLYQIGAHETRALFDVPLDLPAASSAAGGVRAYIRDVALPTLPESVRPSVVAALADGRIPKSMPNSWLPPSAQGQHPGVLLLGDAMNMRHPLTGGGMTVALHDALLLSTLLMPERVPDLGDTAAIGEAMRVFHWRRKRLTSIINVLAQALYALFAARESKALIALQRGCFDYFQRGYTDEPMGLMGGLMDRPLVLAYHFFSVAFLAIWINAVELFGGTVLGLWKLPLAAVEGVMILWTASVVFLPVFWTELQ